MTQKGLDEEGEEISLEAQPRSSSSDSSLEVCQVRADVENAPLRAVSKMSIESGDFLFGMDSLSSASSHKGVSDEQKAVVHGVENILYDNPDVKNHHRQSSSVNSELSSWSTEDGSQTNLGFTDHESEGSSASTGWMWQKQNEASPTFRRDSKSFIDKTRRFVRRGRERLSLIELNRSRNSFEDGPRQPRFMRLTESNGNPKESSEIFVRGNRSSYIDDNVSSRVSLPQRPSSGAFMGSTADGFSRRSLRSLKTSQSRPGSAMSESSDHHSLRTRYGPSSSCMLTGCLRFQPDDHINIFILP